MEYAAQQLKDGHVQHENLQCDGTQKSQRGKGEELLDERPLKEYVNQQQAGNPIIEICQIALSAADQPWDG